MFDWLAYTLLSTIVYAIIALLDRYIMGKNIINPIVYLVIGNVTGLVVAAIAWTYIPDQVTITISLILIGLVVGILYGAYTYLYFLTLQKVSPVATVTYMQIVPVVAAISSIYILKEEITEQGFLAILLLTVGLAFISLLERKHSDKAAKLMVPAVIFLSIAYVIQKQILDDFTLPLLVALNRIGATIFAIYVFVYTRWSNVKTAPNNISLNNRNTYNKLGVSTAIIGEIGSILALFLLLVAYNSGPFAEVSALSATIPVAVLFGAVILNKYTSHKFWEIPEIRSLSSILITISASVLISLAIYIIS